MEETKQKKDKSKNKPEQDNAIVSKVKTFYTNISSEFKRIIWPTKELLMKQTVVVIIICIIIGAIIFGMDTGLAYVLQFVAGFI